MDRKLYPTAQKRRQNSKILFKSFPFYITQKVSKMQGFAQKISNKFGDLPDGIDVKFWYNSLAFTEKCLSYDKQSNDKTAVLRASGYHLGGKHA